MLARQSWQSEAGSLAPLILCLGGWTLWHVQRGNRELARDGSLAIWAAAMAVAVPAYLFACAIEMAAVAAIAAWLGCAATFYLFQGRAVLRRAAFPLLFLALIIPAPYSLSAGINAWLRSWLSERAVELARAVGLEAALGQGTIFVEQYALAVENACAGMSSTISLVAIGLLFAFWIHEAGLLRAFAVAALAVPIAILANILRVVALMALVSLEGSRILDTALHPLSGVISFLLALTMLLGVVWLITVSQRLAGRTPSPRAAN